jgi:hypothetical protein
MAPRDAPLDIAPQARPSGIDPARALLAAILCAGCTLRFLNRLRLKGPRGLNAALLLLDIASRGGELRKCSTSALGMVSGIPRETARRLLGELRQQGWIEQTCDGAAVATAQGRSAFTLADDYMDLGDFLWASHVAAHIVAGDADSAASLQPFAWNAVLATQRECVPHPPYAGQLAHLREQMRALDHGERAAVAQAADSFYQRHLHRLRRAFDGDLVFALLLGEIAQHNISWLGVVEPVARADDALARLRPLRRPLRGTNVHSLSLATGIPDATVRRKVARLVQRGWVIASPRGKLTVDGEAVRERTRGIDDTSIPEFIAAGKLVAARLASRRDSRLNAGLPLPASPALAVRPRVHALASASAPGARGASARGADHQASEDAADPGSSGGLEPRLLARTVDGFRQAHDEVP